MDERRLEAQRRVAAFATEQGYDGEPAYRLLDLAAEVGELAADATKSTGWGDDPATLAVREDEVGDALFSLLLFAESVDVDAGEALDAALSNTVGGSRKPATPPRGTPREPRPVRRGPIRSRTTAVLPARRERRSASPRGGRRARRGFGRVRSPAHAGPTDRPGPATTTGTSGREP